MRACSAHGIIELIESITYRAEWCGIRAIERGEVESPKWNPPYEDERKKHRAAASRHVLALEAQIKEDDKRKLFHIANDLRVYGNHLTNIAQKRVSQLFRTKAYREALKQYHNASSVLSSLDKGTPKYHEAKEKVKDAADVLERLQAQYKLTMEDLRRDMAGISRACPEVGQN